MEVKLYLEEAAMLKKSIVFFLVLIGFSVSVFAAGAKEEVQAADNGVNIAVLLPTPIEEAWNSVYIQALDRVVAQAPHGLEVSYKYVESVATADAERVMQGFIDSGDFNVFVFHGGQFGDAAEAITNDNPDKLIVVNGSGFTPMGGNNFHADVWVHEAAYLLGIVAGEMTKTNVIGAIAAYPYPNVNLPLNGFFAGAKSVNPNVKQVVTYIESWFDPPKVKESAAAQIASGADMLYAERLGVFEAAREGGVYAFGHSSDQASLAPDVVLSSSLYVWDPSIVKFIDIWYTAKGSYKLAAETFIANMADGGCAIAPLMSVVPTDVVAKVEAAKASILKGELKVPFIDSMVVSD